jgi:triosephosphate isomerase
MENKIVVANMKMNMTAIEVDNYLEQINGKINSRYVVLCPTSIYVPYFLKNNYLVGLQNTYFGDSGAYTGEISPEQANSMGVTLTILGHSERRIHFKESNKLINSKVKNAIANNLKVILCIGEDSDDYKFGQTRKVLKNQIINCLEDINQDMLQDVIIAYEPIWAIGSGSTPTNDEIESAVEFIKNNVQRYCDFSNIPVIYGGSVSSENIQELERIPNLSGYLVGGSSLDPNKLLSIIEVVL